MTRYHCHARFEVSRIKTGAGNASVLPQRSKFRIIVTERGIR